MTSIKLTNAQRLLLNEVNSRGIYSVSDSYNPAKVLIELGLVDYKEISFARIALISKSANKSQQP